MLYDVGLSGCSQGIEIGMAVTLVNVNLGSFFNKTCMAHNRNGAAYYSQGRSGLPCDFDADLW